MPRFTFGVIMLAVGLAVVVAELTPMQFDETGSVAGLAGGVVVLVAATLAPRGSKHDVNTEPVRTTDNQSSEELASDTSGEPGGDVVP